MTAPVRVPARLHSATPAVLLQYELASILAARAASIAPIPEVQACIQACHHRSLNPHARPCVPAALVAGVVKSVTSTAALECDDAGKCAIKLAGFPVESVELDCTASECLAAEE